MRWGWDVRQALSKSGWSRCKPAQGSFEAAAPIRPTSRTHDLHRPGICPWPGCLSRLDCGRRQAGCRGASQDARGASRRQLRPALLGGAVCGARGAGAGAEKPVRHVRVLFASTPSLSLRRLGLEWLKSCKRTAPSPLILLDDVIVTAAAHLIALHHLLELLQLFKRRDRQARHLRKGTLHLVQPGLCPALCLACRGLARVV